jgi:uncharacterized protein
MPRLSEAGIIEPAEIRVAIRFSVVEGRVALDGKLGGVITMICQRCMKPVAIDIVDTFELLIVDDESELTEGETGYEPIVADPARLDLRWLSEEQTLLSVPLVPKHADENCAGSEPQDDGGESEPSGSQRPFANLKDLLRKG